MENINKFKSRKDWSRHAWSEIIGNIKNPELSAALDSLLSSYEKENIVKRLTAMALIRQGKSYKQIGEELWLSPTTICSLKKVLGSGSKKDYQSYRFRKNQKMKETKEKEPAKYHLKPSILFDFIDELASSLPKRNIRRYKF